MAQLVEHWLPKPRVAGSSPVYRSKIIGCTNQCTLFFFPTTNIWKITKKNISWKFVQICDWLKTTNHTNLTNNYFALVKGEDGALGVLGALKELRVIGQPIQPATPPTSVRFPFHNEISEICGIRVRHPTTKSASVRFPTHKEISEICGICVSHPTTNLCEISHPQRNQWDPRDLCEPSPPPRRAHTKKACTS